jgi:isopentenyl diphosphate isomerase/L-lactate dehydrogenase-like FMN-dependent dehydrogenase
VPVNIAELERRARRLLTPGVYDYYAGGVEREQTLRANVRAWRQNWLLPRVLRDVSAMALAGARTLTDVAGVTAPTAAHSLDA